ncbi:maleylpyruvate isomerase family mycothiol-dependent enzyme [Nocardia sp. NBC_00508]|uniref:maleylpyruvate isomerase family mycothiol-dependent enzyme n=1 Tax=Nocardia sp. NBC_00508 TaxID=2975992 RepID=UPI002E81BE5D|nr:maleylpyruvate isomerase family mycothiol-dependent enzyme [Nocardia sp. NBC_00508]WUD69645.1 maleylpyruvate isomerase family mycothiol-dependent enzyme [Nocardia sp. NBC_00508]
MTTAASQTPVQLDTVAEATARLLDTIRDLDEHAVTQPSSLPGWTRGHVLAHLARNADSLVNLLLWAHTRVEIPQYASAFLRDSDIEAGAPRPLSEQLADNEAAATRWLGLARSLTDTAWRTQVRTRQGRPIPATEVPWMRLQEVEIHHVDLNAGYQPSDWPAPFVARILPQATADLTRLTADSPLEPFTIRATDTDFTATIGATPTHTISGPAASLAAWLLGRGDGTDLAGTLPTLPAWK